MSDNNSITEVHILTSLRFLMGLLDDAVESLERIKKKSDELETRFLPLSAMNPQDSIKQVMITLPPERAAALAMMLKDIVAFIPEVEVDVEDIQEQRAKFENVLKILNNIRIRLHQTLDGWDEL